MNSKQNIWIILAAVSLGLLVGGGLFLFKESNALSYLSNDPKACINCHVMNNNYISWQKSSHSSVTTCNDCHVPNDNAAKTYLFKAIDGLKHATAFTLRMEPQSLRMGKMGDYAVQNNCVRCHGGLFSENGAHSKVPLEVGTGKPRKMLCWSCHKSVPHGVVKSLSSSKDAIIENKEHNFKSKWIEINKHHSEGI